MEKSKKKSSGIIQKILVVLLTFAVIIVIAFLDPNIASIGEALNRVVPIWLVAAFIASLGYYFFDALMLKHICSIMNAKQKWSDTIITTMIGFFYSALTPFQSGGQPFQVLRMRKTGVPVGASTSILILKLIVWQTGMSLMGTCGIIVHFSKILEYSIAEKIFLIVGYVLNMGVLVLAALILLKPKWIYNIGNKLLAFLHKIKLIRKTEKYEHACTVWKCTIDDYNIAVHFFKEKWLKLIPVVLVALLECISYASVTYFLYRAFGLNDYGFIYIIILQSLLTIAVSFMPLPGAAGASEGGFYIVFTSFFGESLRFPALLLWRLFTYYMSLILGLIAVIIDGFQKKTRIARSGEMQNLIEENEVELLSNDVGKK
ncbi:MAG: lysylphosphatidylglycerol synthase transmembrane domain-containing protein [Clostridia bacterium]